MSNWLAEKLKDFQPEDGSYEVSNVLLAKHLLATEPRAFWRDCFTPGHFCGSAWVTNPARNKTLLLMHPKLHTWLQFGGHADGEVNLFEVALRELEEESGLKAQQLKLPLEDAIFDVDVHPIPAREKNGKTEPEHLHYDVRFLVEVDDAQPLPQSPEGLTFRWFTHEEAEAMFPAKHGRHRMLHKVMALGG